MDNLSLVFVQNIVLPFVGMDCKGMGSCHVVDLVGMGSGGIDDNAGFKGFPRLP